MDDSDVKSCIYIVAKELGLKVRSVGRRPLTNVWQVYFVNSDREIRFTTSPGANLEECTKQFRKALGISDHSAPGYVDDQIDNLRRLRDPDNILASMYGLKSVADSALEPLIQALQNAEGPSYFRARVADTLAMIGDTRAIEPLVKMLNEPDVELRWHAVKALEEIGDETAIAALERLSARDTGRISFGAERQVNVKDEAQKAIIKIKDRSKTRV